MSFTTICTVLREATFRKMSKATKQKQSCFKRKLDSNSAFQYPDNIIQTKNLITNTSSNNNFKDLADSVNFMSNTFDNIDEQIRNVLGYLKK